ncbi:hypothetical protein PCE1_002431 [Barthelona sp. PCE]
MGKSRPEHQAPPEIYYGVDNAAQYAKNSRNQTIQRMMTERSIELLELDSSPSFLLDIGCGTGFSGQTITNEGHLWVGCDIAPEMLRHARHNCVDGDLMLLDIGEGLPFRTGVFDGAISISVIQWLCQADKSYHHPRKRLLRFFTSLYASLKPRAKAVLQFYPENDDQIAMIENAALNAGFCGGIVVDYPNSTKAKKFYLVLMVSKSGDAFELPEGKTEVTEHDILKARVAHNDKRRWITHIEKEKASRAKKGSKRWIKQKKTAQRRKGVRVTNDSKYTGRRRRNKF